MATVPPSIQHSRGICPRSVREANVRLDKQLRDNFEMSLKTYKALKAGLLSIVLAGLAFYAIQNGAEPGPVFWLTAITIGVMNGIEIGEFLAAYAEIRTQQNQPDDQNNE